MGAPTKEQRKTISVILGSIALGFAIGIGLVMWGAHELFEYISETIR